MIEDTAAAEALMTIGGQARGGQGRVAVNNPARLDEAVGSFPQASAHDVEEAVAAASAALARWRRTPVAERACCLAAAGDLLQRRVAEWQELLTRENGKVLLEAGFDIQMAGAALEYYAAHPEFMDDRVVTDLRGTLRVRKQPHGVCAVIVPWNWPLILAALKIGPALLAGNTMVVKGPDYASMALLAALGAASECFPPGVLNVLSGRGPEVGQALVAHPDVAKVALTGGVETGRAVATQAAAQLKRVTLELGGNDAAILLPDVEIDDAVAGNLVLGAFSTAGQVCFGIKRLFVHRSRYDELVAALHAQLANLVVGDGRSAAVRMGPLVNQAQRDRLAGLLDRCARTGLELVELGVYEDGLDPTNGYFLRPHLVLNPPDDAEVVAEEQFGPVLPVLAYDDVDEAIERANSTRLGLCSSLWTADEETAFALADRLEAGTTFINGHTLFTVDLEGSFGGIKDSGYGRECGPEGVEEYVYRHTITNKRV
jgi:acyl-CoA reductase-like NAD-dependent aldehyde dehydrogenase